MYDPQLPLTDLHRHLDGNIRARTILEHARKFNIELPAEELSELIPYVQVVENAPSLVEFLSKLDWGVKTLGDLEACRRVAYENVEDLVFAGIDYAELRFSPYYMAMEHSLPLEGVVEAVIDGVTSGIKDFRIKANLIGIMSRTFGSEACHNELDAILAYKQSFSAIDLAGDELGKPGYLFSEHFAKVRQTDLQITIHAGEAAGPESIWQAIRELGATRIGHGVNAIYDEKLMDHLAKNKIGIESCLTSNIQTSTISCYEEHPLKEFLNHGVLASLNTDDPAVEGIELKHEYQIAAPKARLTSEDIAQLQKNGITMSFLSEQDKKELLDKVKNK
ncbi:adenosine deaminase [Vibrio salinus]|uniref:adenosine deaminase n=1 Tax=Vibrio salinus TaxID=2899784 RepID=UPI001E396080|nr:adenosine deaminase [Vibrio salinus]MCE0493839.1 adenosine deaminase [Vibrio salinus]